MGAEQRKHPATAAGQSHISLAPGSQSTTGCHQPAKTVWMSFFSLSLQQFFHHYGGFIIFFTGPLSLSCEFMKVKTHLMFGIGK